MAVKTAIIGCGIMGRRMLTHMLAHPEYEPAFLWDPDQRAVALAKETAPEAEIAQSAAQAIAKADLVYLACPPVVRKAYALEAADLGKAIFLEKPLGVDIAESERLVSALHQKAVPAAVNFTQAAGPALQGVSQSIAQGVLGDLVGVDIVLTYSAWPRAWQVEADWLRFRAEGGMTREVLSHFLFFSERILGPLEIDFAAPSYPEDPLLCETALLARLHSSRGHPVNILASVGGAQPDRQELTVKGTLKSRRISDFYIDAVSDGGEFKELCERPSDPRAASLKAQLDDLLLCISGAPHRLASLDEALRVQKLVEQLLYAK